MGGQPLTQPFLLCDVPLHGLPFFLPQQFIRVREVRGFWKIRMEEEKTVVEHCLAKHLQIFCHFTQCLRTRWEQAQRQDSGGRRDAGSRGRVHVFASGQFVLIYGATVQSLSRVRLFATPRTAARQASLAITNSQSLLKVMSMSQ